MIITIVCAVVWVAAIAGLVISARNEGKQAKLPEPHVYRHETLTVRTVRSGRPGNAKRDGRARKARMGWR